MNRNMKILRIINILLIILWLITVFNFSKENGDKSSDTSKKVTEKVVTTLTSNKNVSKEEKKLIINRVNPIVRKTAHYTLYLISGILIIAFLHTYNLPNKKKVAFSLAIGLVFATLDEIHQYFVPERTAKVTDVLIDMCGLLTGIIIFYLIKKVIQTIIEHIEKNKRTINS